MKRSLLATAILGSLGLCNISTIQAAEVDTAASGIGYFVTTVTPAGGSSRLDLYKMGTDGVATQVHQDIFPDSTLNSFSASDYSVNTKTGKIYFLEPDQGGTRRVRTWDIEDGSFDGYTTVTGLPSGGSPMFIEYPTTLDDLVKKTCETDGSSCSSTDPETVSLGGSGTSAVATIDSDGLTVGGSSLIKTNSDGAVELGGSSSSVKVGTGSDATTIDGDGLAVGGSNLIKKNSDGAVELGGSTSSVKIGSGSSATTLDENGLAVGGANLIKRTGTAIHIGENSLVTNEVDGVQQLYATDANGDPIDIDITNGTRLLINGRDVEKSIDNVGALSAALGSVPTISPDSKLTCGLGGGTHSGAYAISSGCASKVSDRISVNAAVATVFNNHTGDFDDNLSARAGFTFRLGKIDDSPKVAAQKAAQLHDEVAKMREENAVLLARLQKLEKLASLQMGESSDLASR